MWISDTLGRAYRNTTESAQHDISEVRALEEVDNGLVFFGERRVVPTSLRKEMLHQIHRSPIGIEGCLRRAREVIYWPRMNAEVKTLFLNVQYVKHTSQNSVVNP